MNCSSGRNTLSGADPGFPLGGGANPPGEGADIQIFPKKLHDIYSGAPRGATPPPGSVTDYGSNKLGFRLNVSFRNKMISGSAIISQ